MNSTKKTFRILFVVFMFIAILFSFISYFLKNNVYSKNGKEKVDVIVTKIDEDHTYYEYTVDNVKYQRKSSSTSATLHVGSKAKAYYDPAKPSDSFLDIDYYSVYGLLITGATFGVLAFIFLIISTKQYRDLKWYRENGMVISAKITKVVATYERAPFYIYCEYNGFEGKNTYKSGPLYIDPRPILAEYDTDKITVYLDPSNYKKYMVDTSNLDGKNVNY